MAEKPLSTINVNTNTRINFYTQGHQLAARALLILWLLANSSPEGVLAAPESQPSMNSPQETALASALPTPTTGLSYSNQKHPQNLEYFAGCTLHKYESQYGGTLSSIAREVSRVKGLAGIQQLLRLLGEGQEIVGLQHLLLQLRVMHEWLCIASDQDAEKGMADLEGEFKVIVSLKAWFVKSFNRLRRGDAWHTGTGQKLLDLLKGSLQSFGSVAKQAPDLFQLLRRVAKDESLAVRKAVLSLLVDPPAAWAPEALSIIRELLEDPDPYAGRATLRTLLSLGKWYPEWTAKALVLIRSSLQDGYVRREALETLSTLLQIDPGYAATALGIIRSALQNEEDSVRSAPLRTLSNLIQVAPEYAAAALVIIRSALQDEEDSVRSAALGILSTLLQVAPEHAETALGVIQSALQDEEYSVRSAAFGTLSTLMQIALEHAETALGIIRSALQDEEYSVRSAALGTLSTLIQIAPEHAAAALEVIQSALQDEEGRVRSAALGTLSTLIQIAPEHAAAALEVIQSALQDEEDSVRSAALETLSTLIQIAPDQSEEVFAIIGEFLEDEDPDIRAVTLDVLPELVQIAPEWNQYALKLTLSALQDTHGNVRKAAFRFLERASLKELLEGYWTTLDFRLIPYITPRLYHMPLVVKIGRAHV